MVRKIIVVGIAATIVLAGALAWHLSKPWRERHTFINKCLANTYTPQVCSCTYDAHRELRPPYAAFVRSSVHDSRTEFAKQAGMLFGRKLTEAGTGIDPAELNTALARLGQNATVGNVLREIGRFLARHKYKVAGHIVGGGAVLAVYRTGRVGLEVGQVTYTYEKHCGAITTTAKRLPGRVWDATKEATDWTWRKMKDAGKIVGIGREPAP